MQYPPSINSIKSDSPVNTSGINSLQQPQAVPQQSNRDWEAILADWEYSGLSQKTYCEQHSIKLHIFGYYRRKFRPTDIAKQKLVPVKILHDKSEPNPTANEYQLKLASGAVLSIPCAYDKTSLHALLNLLGAC